MRTDPVLDSFVKGKERTTVNGGLHYIRGNRRPHFSITASVDEKRGGQWHEYMGGCCHEHILKHRPQFADLVALHLSDDNGEPSHALENGFYWLAGSPSLNYGPGKEVGGSKPNLAYAANHFRITEDEAHKLTEMFGDHFSPTAGFLTRGEAAKAKARLAVWVETQKPRWKAEADACVKKHGLVVYGDKWEG